MKNIDEQVLHSYPAFCLITYSVTTYHHKFFKSWLYFIIPYSIYYIDYNTLYLVKRYRMKGIVHSAFSVDSKHSSSSLHFAAALYPSHFLSYFYSEQMI